MNKSTTVKTRTQGYVWINTCYTLDHRWETIVFASDENGNVSSRMNLDCNNYSTESRANEGHKEMVENWKNM